MLNNETSLSRNVEIFFEQTFRTILAVDFVSHQNKSSYFQQILKKIWFWILQYKWTDIYIFSSYTAIYDLYKYNYTKVTVYLLITIIAFENNILIIITNSTGVQINWNLKLFYSSLIFISFALESGFCFWKIWQHTAQMYLLTTLEKIRPSPESPIGTASNR